MASSTVTPIRTEAAAATNKIQERLREARATLDLLYLVVSTKACDMETLNDETLTEAVNSALSRIDEAMEAAEKL